MKNKTQTYEKHSYTLYKVVPYQCCPVCNGTGKVIADGFTSAVFQTCRVCNGAMIIPMYVLPDQRGFNHTTP